MGKASLWSVPVDHFCTLYDNRTGRYDWRGITAQVFLPLIGGAVTWMLGAKITDVSGAVSGISIVAGLLFMMRYSSSSFGSPWTTTSVWARTTSRSSMSAWLTPFGPFSGG